MSILTSTVEQVMAQTTAQTSCPLDCPATCTLQVTLEKGRVTKIDGDHRNPVTDGYICSKVRNFHRHIYGPDRLLYPAIRKGPKGSGQFARIPWAEALDKIAHRMRVLVKEHGGSCILPFSYGGSNGILTQGAMDERLFRRLGTLRLAHTVCAAATGAAAKGLYGKMPGVAYADFEDAELIVIWGANPSASGIHLVPTIRKAQEKGARLVVVDPRRTPLAKKADLHLALRPGTDLPLALAMIRELFHRGSADLRFLAEHATGVDELQAKAEPWTLERAAEACGLSIEDIQAFTDIYASASPALLRCGWGQERNRNGGSATAAILALPAVAGKFGVRGGGYTASNSGAWSHLGDDSLIAEPEQNTRVVNMNRLGRELLVEQDPIRMLFVYNSNPLATLPRQDLVRKGLEREDLFTVVFDQVKTDTARFADVILPATTFLEHHDLRAGYGAFTLQSVEPVIDPVGEALPNGEVFEQLLQLLNLEREKDVPASLMFRTALRHPGLSTRQKMDMQKKGATQPEFGDRPIQFVDVMPRTADRKIHLFPEALDHESPEGLYAFQSDPATAEAPLALISPATRKTISSTLGQMWQETVQLEMHPEDATARGIANGDEVRIFNRFGEVRTRVRVTDELRPGVVFLPKGLWARHTQNGWTSNVLCPDTATDLGAGACFNDTRVEVEKVG